MAQKATENVIPPKTASNPASPSSQPEAKNSQEVIISAPFQSDVEVPDLEVDLPQLHLVLPPPPDSAEPEKEENLEVPFYPREGAEGAILDSKTFWADPVRRQISLAPFLYGLNDAYVGLGFWIDIDDAFEALGAWNRFVEENQDGGLVGVSGTTKFSWIAWKNGVSYFSRTPLNLLEATTGVSVPWEFFSFNTDLAVVSSFDQTLFQQSLYFSKAYVSGWRWHVNQTFLENLDASFWSQSALSAGYASFPFSLEMGASFLYDDEQRLKVLPLLAASWEIHDFTLKADATYDFGLDSHLAKAADRYQIQTIDLSPVSMYLAAIELVYAGEVSDASLRFGWGDTRANVVAENSFVVERRTFFDLTGFFQYDINESLVLGPKGAGRFYYERGKVDYVGSFFLGVATKEMRADLEFSLGSPFFLMGFQEIKREEASKAISLGFLAKLEWENGLFLHSGLESFLTKAKIFWYFSAGFRFIR